MKDNKKTDSRPPFEFDDTDVDGVMNGFDRITLVNSFKGLDLQFGDWSLKVRIPNQASDKKKLFPIMKFCKDNGINFVVLEKNTELFILEFKPSKKASIKNFQNNMAETLDGYLYREESKPRIKIEADEEEFHHHKSDMAKAIAFVMDDVEGDSGKLPLKGDSRPPTRTSGYPEIEIGEAVEFDDFKTETELELDYGDEIEEVDDDELIED